MSRVYYCKFHFSTICDHNKEEIKVNGEEKTQLDQIKVKASILNK